MGEIVNLTIIDTNSLWWITQPKKSTIDKVDYANLKLACELLRNQISMPQSDRCDAICAIDPLNEGQGKFVSYLQKIGYNTLTYHFRSCNISTPFTYDGEQILSLAPKIIYILGLLSSKRCNVLVISACTEILEVVTDLNKRTKISRYELAFFHSLLGGRRDGFLNLDQFAKEVLGKSNEVKDFIAHPVNSAFDY